jgi:hypothetical protein
MVDACHPGRLFYISNSLDFPCQKKIIAAVRGRIFFSNICPDDGFSFFRPFTIKETNYISGNISK